MGWKHYRNPSRLTTPVCIGAVPYISPTNIRSQEIENTRRSIVPQEVRNTEPFDTSINGISAKHRDPTPTWSKVIGRKLSEKSSAYIYLCCRTNLTRDAVLTESPNFMNPGLLYVQTLDELSSIFIPTTRIRRQRDGSNWLPTGHRQDEARK